MSAFDPKRTSTALPVSPFEPLRCCLLSRETGMRRREFFAGLAGAAVAIPLAARAQQAAIPVVGVLNSGPPQPDGRTITAFKQGLKQEGFIDGQNITIEYRWAEDRYD